MSEWSVVFVFSVLLVVFKFALNGTFIAILKRVVPVKQYKFNAMRQRDDTMLLSV